MTNEIKIMYDENGFACHLEATGNEARHINDLLQAENEDRLIIMPCCIGDTVWVVCNVFDGEKVVHKLGSVRIDGIGGNSLNPIWMVAKEPYEQRFTPSSFGKRVFTTREEAEKELERRTENG